MPGPPFLSGDRVTLRTVEEDDVPFIQRHSNDPRVRVPMTFTGPSNEAQSQEHYEEQFVEDDDSVHLLLCRDEEPVGLVMLFRINRRIGWGELACWLAPEYHGEGYASEGLSLFLDHVFDQLHLHRVRARAIVENGPSRGILESLGFEQEGILRDEKYVLGEHQDVALYGLLEDEWRAR